MKVKNPFGSQYTDLVLPEGTEVVRMPVQKRVRNPKRAILKSLAEPIDSKPLAIIAREKAVGKQEPKAVIVVSDNTRPVPYKGQEGILLPIIETLKNERYLTKNIMILIATGTHRAMRQEEIAAMIDSRVIAMGCPVINHDCRDIENLVFIGKTKRGTRIEINKRYMEADLKIATGLVESHFMAGASGGRKAICPGLIGEESTYVFHGPALMADPRSRDLQIEGNPVHEESLEVAKKAGVDFIVNVTLDHAFHITGIYSGDLEKAHAAAVEKIRDNVAVKMDRSADIVVTHGGFVGINHYQCAKCAVTSLGILRKGGYLIIIADTKDKGHVVGSLNYRTMISLLKLQGVDGFRRTISSPDWTFLPEQWQVQQWAKVFQRIPMEHLILYSPKLGKEWTDSLPERDGRDFLDVEEQNCPDKNCYQKMVSSALDWISHEEKKSFDKLAITYIEDGPYVVPMTNEKL